MALNGTDAYEDLDQVPLLVRAAVEVARRLGFANSCLPSHGRLLQLLAGGVDAGIIGETGTGCGVGLAWLASGARSGVRLVSVERDGALAEAACDVFHEVAEVAIVHGDWRELRASGPFDLLALDGGGQGKCDEPPLDPDEWLRPRGLLVMDDFTPGGGWPPLHEGRSDTARQHWLLHPQLLTVELRTQPDAATLVGTFTGERGVP